MQANSDTKFNESLNIEMINSDLGNTIFQNCNFEKFDLNIKSTIIRNVFFITTMLPSFNKINKSVFFNNSNNLITVFTNLKKIFENNGDFGSSTKYHQKELELKEESLKGDDFSGRKEIYSQFKKMYEQRGDSVKFLEYQAKELEIHMNSPEISWSERMNLKFAYWSNNFGTDWVKSVNFLLKWTIPFYLVFIFLQGYRPGHDFKLFSEIFANYFEFLNPLRKYDFFITNGQPEKLKNLTRIWDFFARIFIAFAEYQLIQAFRKYGKK